MVCRFVISGNIYLSLYMKGVFGVIFFNPKYYRTGVRLTTIVFTSERLKIYQKFRMKVLILRVKKKKNCGRL